MDLAVEKIYDDPQMLQEGLLELQEQRNALKQEMEEFEARKRALEQKEKQFELRWKLLIEETRILAMDKEKFEKKKEFYSRVQSHEQQKDNIVHGEMFFSGVSNKQALKKRYKDLLKIYHPDGESGDTNTVQEINREYDNLKAMM